jgi:hypothetical protein
LGGWQGEPFLLHPMDLPIGDEPLVGAPAVNARLRLWLESLASGVPIVDEPTPSATGPRTPTDPPKPDNPDADRQDPLRREPVGATVATEPSTA